MENQTENYQITDEKLEEAREFVRYNVDAMVEVKSEVDVQAQVDSLGVLITVRVAQSDMGRVIGAGGQTAQALRTLLRIVCAGLQVKVNLKIEEPNGYKRSKY